MSASPRERRVVELPILSGALFLGGLLLCVMSAALRRLDLPGWVELRIRSAGGALSAETAQWLRETNFSGTLLGCGLVLIVAAVLFHLGRPRLRRALAGAAALPASPTATARSHFSRGQWAVLAAALLTVGWRYHQTLRFGYFRYDDFDLLAVAHELGFWDAWWLPHGDHFLPLTRLLAFAGWHLVGVTAWPYNLFVVLTMSGVVVLGCLLLARMRVSLAAQLVFVVLMVFWSPWAELMAGYYILSTYLLIVASSLASIWLYLDWREKPRRSALFTAFAVVAAAPLVDVSGWYVPAALAVFFAADFFGGRETRGTADWWTGHKHWLIGLALIVAAELAATFYCYGVVHRGMFVSMADATPRSLGRLIVDLVYLFDAGLLLSIATPFVYARIPWVVFAALSAVMLVLTVAFLVAAIRSSSRERRCMLAASALVLLGIGLMVTLGRPAGKEIFVRWAAKHVGPAYVWLCLLLAVGWDSLWRHVATARRLMVAELTVAALAIFCTAQTAFGFLGMAVAFPPFGYPAEIRDAVRRRAAVSELKENVIGVFASSGPTSRVTTIPALDGNFIQARCPSLFTYNLANYRPFFGAAADRVRLVRNAAMQKWHVGGVATVPVLREAVSPEFWPAVERNTVLQAFYLADAELRSEVTHAALGDGRVIDSDGTTEILVRGPAWDPETAARLRLAVVNEDPVARTEIPVRIFFRTEGVVPQARATLLVAGESGAVHVADLRQLYAFALSARVADLRIVFTAPGRYRVQLADIVP